MNRCGKQPLIQPTVKNMYLQTYKFLKLKFNFRVPFDKSTIEKTMQYIKNRTDNLMTNFHTERKLQTKTRNTMDESFYNSLLQGNNILTLQSPYFV
jgi:hypothetical protein